MPRPRFDNLPEERQRTLLEVAASEFAAHGYQGASLNGIISRSNLSKGAFYYYFDDKADLFVTVVRFVFEELSPDREGFDLDALDRESFWPSLENYVTTSLQLLQQMPWLGGLGRLLYNPPDIAGVSEVVEQEFAASRSWLSAYLSRGRELGAVRSDVPQALLELMFFGAIQSADHWFVEHWDHLGEEQRDELSLIVFDTAKRMAAEATHSSTSSSNPAAATSSTTFARHPSD